MNEKPLALVTSRPDAEVAKDLKAELLVKLEELCLLLDKAVAAGFHVAYGTGARWDGKIVVTNCVFAKHF